jgi:hypothetical protein
MMKTITAIILTSVCAIVPTLARPAGQDYPTSRAGVRFAPLHIYLDSGERPLAAFQFELVCSVPVRASEENASRRHYERQVKIVGVEGGSHEVFSKTPPYYDPAALAKDRIIIAAFSTQRDLPNGRTRVATIHLQILGDAQPQYELKLMVAADADGKEIPAEISFEKGE